MDQELSKNKKLDKIQLCDMCGEPFAGFSYEVVDENYNIQKGLMQCGECLSNLDNNLEG